MDNADLTPPKAMSLSDEQLELALEEAKNQGDGMIAAMVLLEQEAQLREQDEREFAAWVEKLSNDSRPEAQAALAAALGRAPEVITESVGEPVPVAAVEVDPLPVPAPTSDEVSFDDLLSIGAEAATDSISTVPNDFSVTGVVDQIVERVNTDFSASADEDVTALEESAHLPVAAFEPSQTKPSKVVSRNRAAFAVFWNQVGIYAILAPLVIVAWAASVGASLATVLVGSGSGFLVAYGVNLLAMRSAAKSEKTQSIISRATFGVFGNIIPSLFNLASRVLLLSLFAILATSAFDSTVSDVPVFETALVLGLPLGLFVTLAVVILAVAVGAVVWLRKYALRIVYSTTLVWVAVLAVIFGITPVNLGLADTGQSLLLALVIVAFSFATVGLGTSTPESTGSSLNTLGVRLASLAATVIAPIAVLFLLGAGLIKFGPDMLRFDSSALLALLLVAPSWLATASIWVLGALVVVVLVQLIEFAAESTFGLFITKTWIRTFVVVLSATALVVVSSLLPDVANLLSSLLIVSLLGPAIWASAYLTESILRQSNYHEVSLMRSYAFYKRFSIFAVAGYLLVLAFATVISMDWSSVILGYIDPLLISGSFSSLVLGILAASLWTVITAYPKIRSQEREVAAVDERRSEIAGVELPE
jgi:hypothetical protein